MKRAIIYCRLSPTPNLTKEENLAQQLSMSQARCEREGWPVVDTIVEIDTSASKGKRPGWETAVKRVQNREAEVIVARHPDRMYRQPRELEDLVDLAEKGGVMLATAEGDYDLTTVNGRMTARIVGATARAEMEMKATRQRLGHERRLSAGKPWWTQRPFGFEKDGTHRPEEASALKQAYVDLLGGHSLYSIAKRFNEAGLLTTRGNQWRSANLRTAMIHPRNAGILTHDGDETGSVGNWEPIVDEGVYRAVVRLLGDPKRNNHGGGKRIGLLTGIVRCSVCRSVVGLTLSRPNVKGERYRVYICRAGRHISIPADWLESVVMREVIERAEEWANEGPVGESNVDLTALRTEELALLSRQQELAELFAEGTITKAALTAGTDKAQVRLREIEGEMSAAAMKSIGVDIADTELLWEMTHELDGERFRAVVDRLVESIELLPRGKGARLPKREHFDIKFRERQQAPASA